MSDFEQLFGEVFDADEVLPMFSGNNEPMPEGKYMLIFESLEWKQNKAQTGTYLSLTASVVEPDQYSGRKLFVILNLDHPNPVTVDIAKRELGAIAKAVGLQKLKDSSELLNKPFSADVKIEPEKDGYKAKNKIVGYEALSRESTFGASAPADKKLPWKK